MQGAVEKHPNSFPERGCIVERHCEETVLPQRRDAIHGTVSIEERKGHPNQ